MHKPWIPHFGNHIPYTTAQEDKINYLKAELEKAMGVDFTIEYEDEDDE